MKIGRRRNILVALLVFCAGFPSGAAAQRTPIAYLFRHAEDAKDDFRYRYIIMPMRI